MFDAQRLLGSLLGSGNSFKKTDRLTRSLGLPGGKIGAVTLLGGVAMAAYEHFSKQSQSASTAAPSARPTPPPPPPPTGQATPPPPPPPPAMPATPSQPVDVNKLALTLIRAMIAAAKADGEIDPEERRRILERLSEVSEEERAFLEVEMEKPLDLDELITEVSGAETAAEVYTVSLLAIDLDTSAEVKHLKKLARGLGLSEATVNQIHDRAGVVRIFA